MSHETISSSLYPNVSLAAAFIALLICSTVGVFASSTTKSITEPVIVGTRTAKPCNLPFSLGNTKPIALAAPVEVGTILTAAARALLKSRWGASCNLWSAV